MAAAKIPRRTSVLLPQRDERGFELCGDGFERTVVAGDQCHVEFARPARVGEAPPHARPQDFNGALLVPDAREDGREELELPAVCVRRKDAVSRGKEEKRIPAKAAETRLKNAKPETVWI